MTLFCYNKVYDAMLLQCMRMAWDLVFIKFVSILQYLK